MTLVTFLEDALQLLTRQSRWKMDAATGQQTGWIHLGLGDLTIAFVFPVPLLKSDPCESEQGTAHKAAPGLGTSDCAL
jgi:hypothetical protein